MVYLFLAEGFEITEAMAPLDMMRRAKIDVRTVGVMGKNVTASCGVKVEADLEIDEIDMKDCEMVVLPGGMPGSENLRDSEQVSKAVDYAAENGLYMCAICAAPMVLGLKGLLNGKKATCFPGFEDKLIGAEYTGDGVTADGKVITAKGAGRSVEFGLAIVEALRGKDTAMDVKSKIQC